MLKAFAMMIKTITITTHKKKTCIKSITHFLDVCVYYNKRNKADMLSSVMINERKL